jgi:phage baseplate assembly protein W
MATFIGFNTQDQFKKYTLLDTSLIMQDFLNALNIRQGQLVGRPGYGTVLWDFLFETQSFETEQMIIKEIQRVAGGDPRMQIEDIQIFPQENGMLIQLQFVVVPGTDTEQLSIFFDQQTRNASYV